MSRYVKVNDVMNLINTSNRGNCDYFIVDQIEELCMSEKTIGEQQIRAKAIEEFAEKLKYELNGNIIPDNEKFTYARKQQEQICHQNMTLKRAIKYVDYIAEQLKGGAE